MYSVGCVEAIEKKGQRQKGDTSIFITSSSSLQFAENVEFSVLGFKFRAVELSRRRRREDGKSSAER